MSLHKYFIIPNLRRFTRNYTFTLYALNDHIVNYICVANDCDGGVFTEDMKYETNKTATSRLVEYIQDYDLTIASVSIVGYYNRSFNYVSDDTPN